LWSYFYKGFDEKAIFQKVKLNRQVKEGPINYSQ